uniref:Uncharacterized protein n=1 Tax=Anguilla anguilla TaxID=7936 RepID=A0A0E9PL87_ANGAN
MQFEPFPWHVCSCSFTLLYVSWQPGLASRSCASNQKLAVVPVRKILNLNFVSKCPAV